MSESCVFQTLRYVDVEAERAASGRADMDSILSQLSAEQGAAADTTDDSSICMAIYNLGNAAAAPGPRMGHFLPNTAHFVELDAMHSPWFPCIACYEEVCELGSGEHGVVVKARNSVTGEIVALKTLHPKPLYHESHDDESEEEEDDDEEEVADPEVSRRVLREACFMAACRGHPSLVSLTAIGRLPHTAQYCLIMEHVDGPSLYDVLVGQRGGKPFPERDVRRMMRQVMSGAKAMHDRGVVHRAITPHNILVGDDGAGAVVKIGDFAEATSMAETDVPYGARLPYVAPECLLHATGGSNNELADSWSLGSLMLELLMGENHFDVAETNDFEGVLYKVFDVLGVPGKRTMKALKPQDFELAKKVQQWRARQRRVGKQQRSRLDDLVPCDVLSEPGFEVLQGLLMINPKKRLTAAAALQLPWFTENTDDYFPVPQGD